MKQYFLFLFSLSLIFSQCSSEKSKNKLKKSVASKISINYTNKTWNQYTGPNRNGKVESKFIPSTKPKVSWKFEYDGGAPTPLIIDKGTTFFGTESKNIYAIDNNGNLKWTVKLDSEIKNSLLISDNILIAAPDSSFVYGINASNGEIIWKRDFSYSYKSYTSNKKGFFGKPIITDLNKFTIKKGGKNITAPLIENNKVYLTVSKQIIVIDIKNGNILYDTNQDFNPTSLPLITKDVIYTSNGNEHLYAFNKLTGKLIWESSRIFHLMSGKPFIYKDSLYTSTHYHLKKIDKESGEDLGIISSIQSRKEYDIIDTNTYYVAEDGHHTGMGINYGSYVTAFNLDSKKKKWDYNLDGKYITELIMVGDYIYFGDSSGNVRALHKNTGKKRFGVFLEGAISNPLSYANGIIYGTYKKFKDDNHVLFALK